MFNILKTTFCFSLCLYATTAFSKTEMYLSKNEIAFGETTNLIFESDEELKTQPNFELIEKEFKILGKSQSSNVSVINGVMSKKNKIAYTLYPYQKGEFKIGPIELEGQKFEALLLKVVAPPTQQTNEAKPLEIKFESTVYPSQIYEGQVALYTTKITDENTLYDANLKTPFSNYLTFTPLESDKIYQTNKDGKNYRVFERFFIITPQHNGSFHIPPAQLSGLVPDLTKQTKPDIMGDFFNFPFDFNLNSKRMKPVYFNSNENSIEILPKPTHWQGWWFPSNKAEISEDYVIPDTVYVGDVIERRVTLTAANIENAKLPLLEHPKEENLSIFANQEERFSEFKNNELLSTENRTFVLSFQKEGEQIIPAINIKYFNTLTKSEEILTLPEKEINVLAPLKTSYTAPTEQTPPPSSPLPPVLDKNTDSKSFSQTSLLSFIGVFSLLSIGGLFFALKKKKKRIKTSILEEIKKPSRKKKRKKPLPDLYLD